MSSLTKDAVALVGNWNRRGFAEHVPRGDQAVRSFALLVSPVSLLHSCSCAARKFSVLFLINAS